MPRCAGIKRDGGRCATVVKPPHTHCYQHDPDRADERRRNASRAARSRPSREIVGVKAQLEELTLDVLAGELETGRAAVANQLINTRLRAIEQERKNRETEDLEARIEALERSGEGARRWGT
jgi:hypothetical protein